MQFLGIEWSESEPGVWISNKSDTDWLSVGQHEAFIFVAIDAGSRMVIVTDPGKLEGWTKSLKPSDFSTEENGEHCAWSPSIAGSATLVGDPVKVLAAFRERYL